MKENVGILQQRLIEANVIRAVYNSLAKEFGIERARGLVAQVIGELAFEKGRELRKARPAGDLTVLIELWQTLGACPRIRRGRAHGACTVSARREEEAMRGHR